MDDPGEDLALEDIMMYSGPVYECMKCRNRVPYAKLMEFISFRCPVCGFRIFRKVRAPTVKHLKAR